MYKIGIVLFGQPRYYNFVKKYYDEAFPDCEIDYFIHAWNIDSVAGHNQNPDKGIKDITYDVSKLKHELQDVYDTSNIIVSDYDRQCKLLGLNYVHQWRSFEKASKLLKRSKKEYDLITCSRFDTAFEPKPNLIKRLLDIIEENKSPNDELLIIQGGLDPREPPVLPNLNIMNDLIWFGTKKGMIKFGHNFTRNLKTDPKLGLRSFRERWVVQIKRNKVTHYKMSLDDIRQLIVITIVKPGCPSFDIETIKNYDQFYRPRIWRETHRRGNIIKEYDPKIKY